LDLREAFELRFLRVAFAISIVNEDY
jgi:hypothetical protein